MRNWHSLFEILKFPLEMLFLAAMIMGLGNLLTNPAFVIVQVIDNEIVLKIAEMLVQTGRFILANIPILFLLRLSARKNVSGTTVVAGAAGFLAFLMATVFFAKTNLPATSYNNILGISVNTTTIASLKTGSHYPLQTGLVGMAIVVAITLKSFPQSHKQNEIGSFGLLSWETTCTIRTIVLCFLAGVAMSYVWPVVIAGIQKVISFISVDTSNPINLTLYGVMDGLLNTLGLGTMIRTPFWYGTNGGTWLNLAGTTIAGDANIWSAQLAAGSIS